MPVLTMPPTKVDTSGPLNVPTSTPACPALIVPLLEMPPEKFDMPVARMPIPALALMVPVLLIPDELREIGDADAVVAAK